MPYILRSTEGKIIRASVRSIVGGEQVQYNHIDLVEFLKSNKQDPKDVEVTLAELHVTDVEMSRGIEDVILVLLKKGVIKMLDLPNQLQDRMALRVRLRQRLEDLYEKATKNFDQQKPPARNQPLPVATQVVQPEAGLARVH